MPPALSRLQTPRRIRVASHRSRKCVIAAFESDDASSSSMPMAFSSDERRHDIVVDARAIDGLNFESFDHVPLRVTQVPVHVFHQVE